MAQFLVEPKYTTDLYAHIIVGVQAGLGQCGLGSLHKRIGGDGRTTDAVEVDGVAFHDFAGELLNEERQGVASEC